MNHNTTRAAISPLSPEYSKAGGARGRSQADRLVGRRRSAGRLSCTSRATPRTVPAAFEGDIRRFPKGERKALWCARRRIPCPQRQCAAYAHKMPRKGTRRFPKGERKALWCAHGRIPRPTAAVRRPAQKKLPYGSKKGSMKRGETLPPFFTVPTYIWLLRLFCRAA